MSPETPEDVEIRWAGPGDRAAIAELVLQTKRHYGEEPAPAAAIEAAVADWLAQKPGHALFVIAHVDGAPAGYASVAVTPPGMGLCAALYMKELFVSSEARGHGIGHRLLAFIARYCVDQDIERIDLTTAVDNDAGIRFYERAGATVQKQKIALRFETASLRRLAGEDHQGE
ncbi:GNAT family N-acetyltransferase [Oricola sp.]|uniref:GNAT family N-acetyltransferase n=1 Tax=Oricola sp. TaxID=1979950 RepID=UPI0025EA8238|nr:GNAT family N-acetyltransferase [Oricola sp.]MCI5077494.1 GNAT family N-acetyltransferase [Oricola sp.]